MINSLPSQLPDQDFTRFPIVLKDFEDLSVSEDLKKVYRRGRSLVEFRFLLYTESAWVAWAIKADSMRN